MSICPGSSACTSGCKHLIVNTAVVETWLKGIDRLSHALKRRWSLSQPERIKGYDWEQLVLNWYACGAALGKMHNSCYHVHLCSGWYIPLLTSPGGLQRATLLWGSELTCCAARWSNLQATEDPACSWVKTHTVEGSLPGQGTQAVPRWGYPRTLPKS